MSGFSRSEIGKNIEESFSKIATEDTITIHSSIVDTQISSLNIGEFLIERVLQDSAIHYHQLDIRQIQASVVNASQWQLKTATDEVLAATYDHVLICTALNSPLLCQRLPALKPIRGQVSWFNPTVVSTSHQSNPAQTAQIAQTMPITYGGYMAQIHVPDAGATVLLGASFIRQDHQTDIRLADHQHNLGLIQAIAPTIAAEFPATTTWQGRAAIRAQTLDYLPLAGAVTAQHGVWTLSGLGSKGFSYAPLCAEIICAQLFNEVYPVSREVIQSINPERFAEQ
ncbi:MAG: FAD-dependent oxidoreductase [Moraxellaceae bacterium]|nr:MAG: FAD-dependent oxidoreductase [Moraxellaceae bacterium]